MPRRSASASLARNLGARIRALREEAGITQEKLAWECGFAKGFLSQVEAGKSVPSLAALVALARRLGVDAVDVLAADKKKPLHRVLDAIRRRDDAAVRDELKEMGLEGAARRAPEQKAPGSRRQRRMP